MRDCGLNTAKALQELEHYRSIGYISALKVPAFMKDTMIYRNFQILLPYTYWRYYADNEMLPKVAKILYHILASSSVCEQSFRDHEYIYSNRRLRTDMGRFEKLVFLFSNRRLNV